MTRGRRTLHIRCGDDIRDKLAAAGLAGDYLAFTDPIWLGPSADAHAWISGRAKLIAERTGRPQAKIRAELGDAYWQLARAPVLYDHIVLWFEHDLYDQAALVRILASLAVRKKLPKVELICIDRFRGIRRFIGLGQLSADQLASLWRKRGRVSRQQLALGAETWKALRAAKPEALEALLKSGLGALPFLKAALRRHLQELPWTTDGLSLTERGALAALVKGPRAASDLFKAAQVKAEPAPFMGDLFFWATLRDLLAAPHPPIAVSAATRRAHWSRRVLRLTPIGKAVLAGRLDWQATWPRERWVGGIPVGAGDPSWRWNPRTNRTAQQK
ncbi:MAG: hypothetical protein ACHQK9_09050 [Reyranellales bacterium]